MRREIELSPGREKWMSHAWSEGMAKLPCRLTAASLPASIPAGRIEPSVSDGIGAGSGVAGPPLELLPPTWGFGGGNAMGCVAAQSKVEPHSTARGLLRLLRHTTRTYQFRTTRPYSGAAHRCAPLRTAAHRCAPQRTAAQSLLLYYRL